MGGTQPFTPQNRISPVTLAFLLLTACQTAKQQKPLTPDELYRSISQKIVSYNLESAEDAARKAWLASPASEDGWRFKLLCAETLIRTDRANAATQILADPLPGNYPNLRPRYDYLKAWLGLRFHEPAAPIAMQTAIAEARAAADHELEADALIRLHDETNSNERETLDQAKTIAAENHLDYQEANALNSLGALELRQNRFAEALVYLRQSASKAKIAGAKYVEASALQNEGECLFNLGDFGRALDPLLEAQKLLPPGDNSRLAVDTENDLGTYYSLRKQDDQALDHYRKAFALAEQTGGISERYILSSLNLASGLIQTGAANEAEKYNNIAAEASQHRLQQGFPALNPEWPAAIEVNRADIAALRSQPELAARSYQTALQILQKEPPTFTQVLAYAGIAEAKVAQHKTAEARTYFEKALASIELNRTRQTSAQYQIQFLSALMRFYQRYVDFLMSQNQPWLALAVADSSRASVLAEGSILSRQQPDFLARIKHQAQSSASTFLFYWLSPQNSYLWIISPTASDFKQLTASQDTIEQDVKSYSAAIQNGREDTLSNMSQVGMRLFDTLITPAAPVLQSDSRVVVIPDGALHGLNFETLIVKGDQPHYWIDDVTVTVAPSLGLLLTGNRNQAKGSGALVVGDPLYGGSEYPLLPESKLEVQKVSARFPNNARLLVQKQASADSFELAHPELFSLIHFSAHVEANPESPLDSAIILSPAQDGSRQLYARDFMNTHLNADLVTISGCRSAGPKELSGEGMVGFAWAAFKAGAKNAVTSLWAVDDQSTTELMDHFYAHVTSGQPYAQALREAKLHMLTTRYKQPFYWAPFQLYSRNLNASGHPALN